MLKSEVSEKAEELSQWRHWRRFDRMLVRYAILTIAVLALVLISFAWIEHLNNQFRDYEQIRLDARSLLKQQLDEETGIRGYDATRSTFFLTPYTVARTQIGATIDALSRRIAEPASVAALNDFRRRHVDWVGLVAVPMLAKPTLGSNLQRERVGQELVDGMRADVAIIDSAYDRLSGQVLNQARLFEALCVLLIVLVGGLVAALAYSSERNAAQREEELIVGVMAKRDTATRIGEWRTKVVAMLAHDFRSTLGVIKAYCTMLEDFPDQRNDPAIYASIERAVAELAEMSDEALLMARMSGGALSVGREELSIAEILETIVERYRREREISLENADFTVMGDRSYLLRVFDNLVGNAVKYSPPEAPIDVRATAGKGGTVDVTVSDRGRGIDPAELPHIFEEYWRSPNVGSSKGTGVGLFIVKKIVEAHGGTIRVASRVGHGTDVCVTLLGGAPAVTKNPASVGSDKRRDR